MRPLDWGVLVLSLAFIVVYGLWRSRRNQNLEGYFLAGREMRWWTIALSIMATQASAITFLSTPGQGYADGMRFVQFYLGLPVAMVILSITFVPIYHRLGVYTAYEFLETRFDLKTRLLASTLFLVQRGLSTGLTIYAPSLILSVILGWNIYVTNLVIGILVIVYTTSGGTRAVNWTNFQQMLIVLAGMATAFVLVIHLLPAGVSFRDAAVVAGKMGRLRSIDFHFDWNNRYTFWSGMIGGLFLQLSYFGTDQSQVQRYLTGRSVAESRLGLLFNGLVKIPMQFGILFLGCMIFVFYQFTAPPVFFNPVETASIANGPQAATFREIEKRHLEAAAERQTRVRELVRASHSDDRAALTAAERELGAAEARIGSIRKEAVALLSKNNPSIETNDSNYVFLSFVIHYLPAGVVGLILAVVFASSMSSTSSALNALASTTIVDLYKRVVRTEMSDRHYVRVSRAATVFWGIVAIAFAEYANRLGSLIEAVNILGSLFYGTILGIFLLAFYVRKTRGTAVFLGALAGEAITIACASYTGVSFLWYNVVGCAATMIAAVLLDPLVAREERPEAAG